MKAFDIACKDLLRSFRSTSAMIFMFGIPLLVTGMFYLMFGNVANDGEFNLPKTSVVIANLDAGTPRFRINARDIPGGTKANTLGELVVEILQSEGLADLIEPSLTASPEAARTAVDAQQAQVALIIPADFSRQFADADGQAVIEFYQDPTLTIGPAIIRVILNRFMDRLAGVKIAVKLFTDEVPAEDQALAGEVIRQYLDRSLAQAENGDAALLEISAPTAVPRENNLLQQLIGPIMGGMMIFYAFFTGASSAQSILREEEEYTLPRLFTTPTPQATILGGKFLAVFLTVLVQVVVLLLAARFIFGVQWGEFGAVAVAAIGIVLSSATAGICLNAFLKDTRQSGPIFGGVLTISGMVGMIRIFAVNSPAAEQLGRTVSLLVPQGWAVRGLLEAMNGAAVRELWLTGLVLLIWSVAFFGIGVWRFNRRYT